VPAIVVGHLLVSSSRQPESVACPGPPGGGAVTKGWHIPDSETRVGPFATMYGSAQCGAGVGVPHRRNETLRATGSGIAACVWHADAFRLDGGCSRDVRV